MFYLWKCCPAWVATDPQPGCSKLNWRLHFFMHHAYVDISLKIADLSTLPFRVFCPTCVHHFIFSTQTFKSKPEHDTKNQLNICWLPLRAGLSLACCSSCHGDVRGFDPRSSSLLFSIRRSLPFIWIHLWLTSNKLKLVEFLMVLHENYRSLFLHVCMQLVFEDTKTLFASNRRRHKRKQLQYNVP